MKFACVFRFENVLEFESVLGLACFVDFVWFFCIISTCVWGFASFLMLYVFLNFACVSGFACVFEL